MDVLPPPPVEVARAESERGELVLRQRGGDLASTALELRVNGVYVMGTAQTSTEAALAAQALELVEHPRRVLVGGLGLGFTMHEVLIDSRVEHLNVVEIEDALVGWMRDGTIPHGPQFLADGRLTVTVADIATALAEAAPASYDLVLLDVDNGPGYLVYDANAALYQEPFLSVCRSVIAPGGALVVWSADQACELETAVRSVFGNVEARAFDVALQGRAEHYWLYLGRVSAIGPAGPG